MFGRLLLIYAVVEVAAAIALASTVGWGWTLLALLAAFLLGSGVLAPMAGSHLIRQVWQLRSGLAQARGAASDGALVALAAILVLVPGLVTTAVGLLLLVPPIRSAAAPGLSAVALRSLRRRAPLVGYTGYARAFRTESPGGHPGAAGDYIDGEVVDVHDHKPAALPTDPVDGERPASSPGAD